jgi:dolichol kinase
MALSPRTSTLDAARGSARPAGYEWRRMAFHFLSVNAAMAYFYFTDTVGAYVLAGVGTVAVLLDVARVHGRRTRRLVPRFFLSLVRGAEERRLSPITGFVAAAVLIDVAYLAAGLPKDIVLAASAFVSCGDPAARVVGITWGRTPLLGGRKTLEGSLAFLAVGLGAAFALCLLLGATFTPSQLLAGALVATAAELLSIYRDNFTIVFFATAAMWLVRWLEAA